VPGKTVLVAESDRALRELLRVHLHNAGYNVILAPDATIAGRALLQSPRVAELLIINAQLPFMSGLDFVSTLIADTSLRFVPTILICGSDEEARRADILGVPCLIAPFSAEQLMSLVRGAGSGPDPAHPAAAEPGPSMRERLAGLAKRPLRIVLADDEPDTVTSLMAILSHEGHSVFGTQQALEVLPEVRLNRPDAVILDIDMPKVSGFAIARDIREMFGDASPLLIAVSGKWVGQTDKMLAQLAGFDYFLQKPCRPDALVSLLQRARPEERTVPEGIPCEPSHTFQT
jgi:DNA-binding response OmpR family regulator